MMLVIDVAPYLFNLITHLSAICRSFKVMYDDHNYIDEVVDDDTAGAGDDNRVPRSNAAAMPVDMMMKDADESPQHSYSAPMHVLFNQLGSLCTRFNKRITGTQFQDITLWAKPPSGTLNTLQVNNGEILTEEELRAGNWTKVRVQVSRERLVKSNHLEGRRRQYCLRHIFSSTINKMMGSTIYGPVAIQVSRDQDILSDVLSYRSH